MVCLTNFVTMLTRLDAANKHESTRATKRKCDFKSYQALFIIRPGRSWTYRRNRTYPLLIRTLLNPCYLDLPN